MPFVIGRLDVLGGVGWTVSPFSLWLGLCGSRDESVGSAAAVPEDRDSAGSCRGGEEGKCTKDV